jgi:hypothetical protein
MIRKTSSGEPTWLKSRRIRLMILVRTTETHGYLSSQVMPLRISSMIPQKLSQKFRTHQNHKDWLKVKNKILEQLNMLLKIFMISPRITPAHFQFSQELLKPQPRPRSPTGHSPMLKLRKKDFHLRHMLKIGLEVTVLQLKLLLLVIEDSGHSHNVLKLHHNAFQPIKISFQMNGTH